MPKPTSSGTRTLKAHVKTARGRSNSSVRWLKRQLNDPYVARAKQEGYRSRAAYKLLELDERFKFLKPGKTALDLGAAPGGWTQVAVEKKANVVGIDLLPIDPLGGATLLQLDFMADDAPARLRSLLPTGADIVLSDMAPNTTGHAATDHLRIMALLDAAYHFACEVLKPNGVFVAKLFQGGAEKELLMRMKQDFAVVKHAKPQASRADSAEMYVVATGFRKAS